MPRMAGWLVGGVAGWPDGSAKDVAFAALQLVPQGKSFTAPTTTQFAARTNLGVLGALRVLASNFNNSQVQ